MTFKDAAYVVHGITILQEACHSAAAAKGFHERWRSPLESLALIMSEAGEAVEAVRKVDPAIASEIGVGEFNAALMERKSEHIPEFSAYEEELADIIIRVCDEAGARELRLADAIIAKLQFNATRPHKHGKKA